MKHRVIIYCLIILFPFLAYSQNTRETLYRSDHWLDIKGKGDLIQANNDPIYEKVEILKMERKIKVTFGKKVYDYKILSAKRYSSVMMNYSVTLNGKHFVLSIGTIDKGMYGIEIKDNWIVITKSKEDFEDYSR